MSDFISDIGSFYAANTASAKANSPMAPVSKGSGLNMNDFLTLMVTELQSQSIDSTADTSEMLSQMVMMQMVDALTNMTDASVMGYAASLVGKTVTVGERDASGKVTEIVGTVSATGSMNGQQVVFVNDKYYYMNEIMAVGTLPKIDPPKDSPQTPPDEDADVPTVPEKNDHIPIIPEKPADHKMPVYAG